MVTTLVYKFITFASPKRCQKIAYKFGQRNVEMAKTSLATHFMELGSFCGNHVLLMSLYKFEGHILLNHDII